MNALYRDRSQAGRLLAARLWDLASRRGVRVVGLVPGGVPVAFEVALALGLPLHVIAVGPLTSPGVAGRIFGAVAQDGAVAVDARALHQAGLEEEAAGAIATQEARALARLAARLDGPPLEAVRNEVAVLVDEGVATGLRARAACLALRDLAARTVVFAAPLGDPAACAEVAQEADACVVALEPEGVSLVGNYYEHFPAVTESDIRELLSHAVGRGQPWAASPE